MAEPIMPPDLAYLTAWAEMLERAAASGGYGSEIIALMKEKADHLRRAIAALHG